MHHTQGKSKVQYSGWPEVDQPDDYPPLSVPLRDHRPINNTTKENNMHLNAKQKTVLLRFARTVGAIVVAGLAAWLIGPDALAIIPDEYEMLVTAILVPVLVTAEKWLRYGQEPNEDPAEKVMQIPRKTK